MRYSVLGFNQELAIEANLDLTDLMLLQYIMQANGTPDMNHVSVDGVSYVWLSHKKIHEDLPILYISEGTLKNRLLSLKKRGYVMSTLVRTGNGTHSYYSITKLATSLINDVRRHSEMTSPRHSEVTSDNILDNNKLNDKDNSISIDTNTTPKEEYSVNDFVSDYNSICKSLPKCVKLTLQRRKSIQSLLKKYSKEEVLQVFNKLEASDFCKGINDRGWKADFDFILKESKFVLVLEGKYDNKGSTYTGGRDKFGEYGQVKSIPFREEKILNEAF